MEFVKNMDINQNQSKDFLDVEKNSKNQSKGCFEKIMNCLPSFSFCGGDANILIESREDENHINLQQTTPNNTLGLTKINQMELKQFAPPYRNVVSL